MVSAAEVAEMMKGYAVPAVAVVGAYIAWVQARTARHKLKLDLYDRRFKVYTAVVEFVELVISKVKLEHTDFAKFTADTAGTEFLFRPAVSKYIDVLRGKVIRLRRVNRELEDTRLPVGDERTALANEDAEILNWISDQSEHVQRVFKPYLWFGNVR